MLSDEIKKFVGETDRDEELESLIREADTIEARLEQANKTIESNTAEIAKWKSHAANMSLMLTEKVDKSTKEIEKDDLLDLTEEEFDKLMKEKYE